MRDVPQETHREVRELAAGGLEAEIAAVAASQHGVIALRQLVEIGLTPRAAQARAACGRWRRLHRGVYAFGHAELRPEGHWMAAVLACGPQALLSHRTAAALLELVTRARGRPHVTTPGRGPGRRAGIATHGSSTLAAADATAVAGIPCTAVARTLLDIAETEGLVVVERAFERAQIRGLLDLRALDDLIARNPGRRGLRHLCALRSVIADQPPLVRSEMERRFLALCRAHRLPPPGVNAVIGGLEVDFSWTTHRLAVEVDGYRHHGGRVAFERDRERDAALTLAGWRVLRFTWRRLAERPADVAAMLRRALGLER